MTCNKIFHINIFSNVTKQKSISCPNFIKSFEIHNKINSFGYLNIFIEKNMVKVKTRLNNEKLYPNRKLSLMLCMLLIFCKIFDNIMG